MRKQKTISIIVPDDLVNIDCPRCGRKRKNVNNALNALSRHRDEYICSDCGVGEAMEDYGLIKRKSWWIDEINGGKRI